MKSTTERRLLLALLVSSLAPLLAMGFLAGAAIHQLGESLEEQARETRDARAREALGAMCRDSVDRVAAFLRRREADLRALALIPRNPGAYDVFQRTNLGPLWAEDEEGEATRVWVPLYAEVAFVAPSGRAVCRAPSPAPATAAQDMDASLREVLAAPPDTVSVAPAPERGSGALRFALTVVDSREGSEGVSTAVLDPRHVKDLFRGAATPSRGATEGWQVFLFQGAQPLVVLASAAPSHPLSLCLAQALPGAAEGARAAQAAVLAPTRAGELWRAYAPLWLDGEGAEAPAGGVLLCADVPEPAPGQTPEALARRAEARIGALTAAATLGVALAALLVARRMAVPWVRLREKARAVIPGETPPPRDELDEIARSFDSLASQVATSAGLVRAGEDRLREFFEMSPDGIAVMDLDGRLLHFNRGLCQILRRTPSELGATDTAGLWVRPQDRDEMLRQLREGGRLRNFEAEFQRGDGRTFPALLTVRLARVGDGECLDVILKDISEWKENQRRDREKTEALFRVYGELSHAHQALRRAYAEVEEQVRLKTSELRAAYEALQAADRVKTEFLMSMSHELRTPLNCIIGYSEAMVEGLDGPVTAEQADSLGRVAQSGRRLLRMIEDLLTLSRIEAGRLDVRCAETRVEEILEDVLHQARNLVGGKPVRLELAVEEPLPAVWADPDRVRQVLFNLLGNALKFTSEGWVRIEARRAQTHGVLVCVRDTGAGIPPEFLDAVFERFAQAPGADRCGVGLGLAISREIVERMGGKIWVESSLGAGSCFGFTLPAAGGTGQLALPLGQG